MSKNKNIVDNLSIHRYPPKITAEEEHDLAMDLYENHNLDAAKKLVLSQMRFVAYVAGEYRGYGLEHNDLVQEGTIGLMKAVKKFNPHKKVRLSTFSVYWIRAEIHEFIFKNWKIVKIATTKAQRKLFFKLNKARSKLVGPMSEDKVIEIANDLGVKPKDVTEMSNRLAFTPMLLDDNLTDNKNPELPAPASSDPEHTMMLIDDQAKLNKAMIDTLSTLSNNEIEIIQSRFFSKVPLTLSALAKRHGVSAEAIRKQELKIIKKIQQRIKQE